MVRRRIAAFGPIAALRRLTKRHSCAAVHTEGLRYAGAVLRQAEFLECGDMSPF